jgi:transposase-like protein
MGVMIQETMTHACRVCKSTHIVKNGTNRGGNAQYHCKDCGTYRVLTPKQAYSESEQHTVLRACLERCSLRGVARIFAMARQTVVLQKISVQYDGRAAPLVVGLRPPLQTGWQ